MVDKDTLLTVGSNQIYSEYEHIDNLIRTSNNNFLETFLFAYNNHLPLKIRPDDIHLALQLIFSTTITNNKDKLRSLFVDMDNQEKKLIEIELNHFDFTLILQSFRNEIKSNMLNKEFSDKFSTNYSTTNHIISNSSGSLLMNASKEYFTYKMYLSCGIPEIIMTGTNEDWIKLNDFYHYMKNLFIKEYDLLELIPWFENFDHVMNMFIELSRKDSTDLSQTDYAKFWSRVITYTPYGSGNDQKLGGWIRLFFPYNTSKQLNPLVSEKIPCLDTFDEFVPSNNYYKDQKLMAKFYGADGEESIPESVQKTELCIKLKDGSIYSSNLVSGFYSPHLDSVNSESIVEFNIGTEILETLS